MCHLFLEVPDVDDPILAACSEQFGAPAEAHAVDGIHHAAVLLRGQAAHQGGIAIVQEQSPQLPRGHHHLVRYSLPMTVTHSRNNS